VLGQDTVTDSESIAAAGGGGGGGFEVAGLLLAVVVVLVAVVTIDVAATDVLGEPLIVGLADDDAAVADIDAVGDADALVFGINVYVGDAPTLAVLTALTIVVALVSATEFVCEVCGRDDA
jgi:hypothetical protein